MVTRDGGKLVMVLLLRMSNSKGALIVGYSTYRYVILDFPRPFVKLKSFGTLCINVACSARRVTH